MNIDIKIQPAEPKPTGVSFSNISEIRNLLKNEQAPSQATSNQTSSSPNFAKMRIENMNHLTRPAGHQVAQPVITRIHNCLLCRFTWIPNFDNQTLFNIKGSPPLLSCTLCLTSIKNEVSYCRSLQRCRWKEHGGHKDCFTLQVLELKTLKNNIFGNFDFLNQWIWNFEQIQQNQCFSNGFWF